MNILVTGGAGFIGSHVVDSYIELGHNVIVVDNLSSGSLENLNPKAKFYHLDIRDDKVEEIFKSEKIDIVNHHAAQMDVRKSVEDPIYDADVNIIGSLKLLQFSIKYGVKKFIFASTGGAIYGEQDYFPADEEHPTRPLSPYGVAKLTVEKYLYFYKEVHGLNYVILRYANIYGPRQNPHGEAGVVAIFTSKMLKGEQPIINGDGFQTRDYTYVGDVVKANLLALNYDKSDVFNIGTGIETDVNTLFRKLKELTGANCDEVHGPPKPGEQRRSVISYEKVYRTLGWKPEISLDEGLKLTVEFFKNKFAERSR
ncbi:UDP-glucose 4-epimerase [Candidatus Kryptobacter tengchongensis]|uniref:UDP-glucose 4-epimerase n=1 Tax=Kryptobacter tengchongensis TaxID=1643429 RepID=A0A656D469_KRYT1|nr:SDR family oxidoreductase [Candidatus Kryptobacter tengchongensis]CUS96861.1 UDP-glucose 4-epimerase [Candidatus Kryptobacter tengchongensis]CUU01397.1 UDP-glucose 4-epimerase [Candidatus Kryptobacter tengchongensis]